MTSFLFFCHCIQDIKCEMDSLECQRIRKLTQLYKQLKTPESTIERIEFISELADALKAEPHSATLSEVKYKVILLCLHVINIYHQTQYIHPSSVSICN